MVQVYPLACESLSDGDSGQSSLIPAIDSKINISLWICPLSAVNSQLESLEACQAS